MSQSEGKRQRLPGEDRRRQILAIAQRLFAEHGFHATTAREIARAAGVSDALMYVYFRTKQEVFDAIIDQGMQRFERSAHREVAGDLSMRAYLLDVGKAFLQLLHEERDLLIILISLQHDVRWAQFVDRAAQQLSHHLGERIKAGELRPETDGYLVARSFFGGLVSHVLLENVLDMQRVHPVSDEIYLSFVVETLLHGILR